uniref:Uncharacterized protein n=1 Tax=Moniliophthora roreri TaxID=221103 RepID=A0A0W0FGL7_MONRR
MQLRAWTGFTSVNAQQRHRAVPKTMIAVSVPSGGYTTPDACCVTGACNSHVHSVEELVSNISRYISAGEARALKFHGYQVGRPGLHRPFALEFNVKPPAAG